MASTIFSDSYKGASGSGTTDGGAVYVAIRKSDGAVAFIREDARGALGSIVIITAFGSGCKSCNVFEESAANRAALRATAVISVGTTRLARSKDGGRSWQLMP